MCVKGVEERSQHIALQENSCSVREKMWANFSCLKVRNQKGCDPLTDLLHKTCFGLKQNECQQKSTSHFCQLDLLKNVPSAQTRLIPASLFFLFVKSPFYLCCLYSRQTAETKIITQSGKIA
ncbi:hypothetical protein AMECASPLE_002642 [Ameca splendens]|uniref:Uncharacterized protein n=1 Tax=Ameca splendens TaxID=208324 RepID=A0ABV0ZK72_9TELE